MQRTYTDGMTVGETGPMHANHGSSDAFGL